MVEKKAKFGDLIKSKIVRHPENCVGCNLCTMACSLKYEGVVSPAKARIKIIRKNNITEKIITTAECTLCGHCTSMCNYGAIELSAINR